MLVNVHKPELDQVQSLDSDTRRFHVITVLDGLTGGTVDMFIDADWSNWDAIVEQVTQHRNGETIRAAGAEYGRAAGSWVIDGNTSCEHAQRIIDGYDEGDPEIMDMAPAPLSGEAEGPSPDDVLALIGIDLNALDGNGEPLFDADENGAWLDEYENAYSDAFWAEVIRVATIVAAPDDDDRVTVSVAGEQTRVEFGTAQLIEKVISDERNEAKPSALLDRVRAALAGEASAPGA